MAFTPHRFRQIVLNQGIPPFALPPHLQENKSMSHEGIRPGTPEDLREEELAERELPLDAKDPAKVRIHKTEGTGVEIDWKDGHHSAWSFTWLRDACPCATCVDERQKSGRGVGEPRPQPVAPPPPHEPVAPAGAHVSYQWRNPLLSAAQAHGPLRLEHAAPVGNYAVSFTWNDGHKTGIYSFDYLRRHCQCDECKAASARQHNL